MDTESIHHCLYELRERNDFAACESGQQKPGYGRLCGREDIDGAMAPGIASGDLLPESVDVIEERNEDGPSPDEHVASGGISAAAPAFVSRDSP